MWYKQSSFENIDYHTDYTVLCLSSTIFLDYSITIKTLSPHNQTSVTKEWMGLSTEIVVYAGLRLTGPQGEIGGRPQKSSAVSGTKNPRATYRTWLTVGLGKVPV